MPPVTKLRGADMLLPVSIIMIIFGVISIGSGAISMFSGRILASAFSLDASGVQYFQMVGAISLISGAAILIFGVFGLKFRNREDRAGFLLVAGIVLILIEVFATLYNNMMAPAAERVVEQIMQVAEQSYGVSSAMSSGSYSNLSGNPVLASIGFILPALFVTGALLNRLPPKVLYTPPKA